MTLYVIIAVAVLVAAIVIYRKKAVKEVPQGLQVFDANKSKIFDMDTSLMRVVERRTLRGSGTISAESLGYYGSKIFVVVLSNPYYYSSYTDPPEITMAITDTALVWENIPEENEGVPSNILIGVY